MVVVVTVSAGEPGDVGELGEVGPGFVGSVSVGTVTAGSDTEGTDTEGTDTEGTLGRVMLGREVGSEIDPLPEQAVSATVTSSVVTAVPIAGARLMRDCPCTPPRRCLTRPG
ncbi:hypothetical protein GCM10009868_40010 [Terrabacter aerolatus]|uniref:Uncharacterized protein n=1 Tax=Terrabacter aerolatus TaxID=422442 RepID=A0A512D084_9MICO|nr:hypothetical protein TAE01_16760 [Terrabacter aerolatus]